MSTAKQLIIDNLSNISDDIEDEFEVMENLYKLMRYQKSVESIKQNGGHTSEEVREIFHSQTNERKILA